MSNISDDCSWAESFVNQFAVIPVLDVDQVVFQGRNSSFENPAETLQIAFQKKSC
jgi:hypothetical protein